MATLTIPAPRQDNRLSDTMRTITQLYGIKQQRETADRRAAISETYNELLKDQNDIARQANVARSRGLNAEAATLEAQNAAWKNLTEDQQTRSLMAKADAVVNTRENNAQKAQINAANQQIKTMQNQLQYERFAADEGSKTSDNVARAIPGAEGVMLGEELGAMRREMVKDPSAILVLGEQYSKLWDKTIDLSTKERERQFGEKKELAAGNYSQQFLSTLPEDLQAEAHRSYFETGEPLDIRYLKKGLFIGGKPGYLFDQGAPTRPYSSATAEEAGYSLEEWNNANSVRGLLNDNIRAKKDEKAAAVTDTGIKEPTTSTELQRMMQENPAQSQELYDKYINKVKIE